MLVKKTHNKCSENIMIPFKIKPYFTNKCVKNNITSGNITRCDENIFNIYYDGKIAKRIILAIYLYLDDDVILVTAKCLKSDKKNSLFNSSIDGYDTIKSTKKMFKINFLLVSVVKMWKKYKRFVEFEC